MAPFDMFRGNNFQRTIKEYCKQIGWDTYELDNSHAVLVFPMPSGQNQALWIIPFESTIEFSVPSIAQFDRESDLPHELSTKLLLRNSQKKFGFWCIESIGGRSIYTYMHNAELQLMNASYFGNVVAALITECEEFENALRSYLRTGGGRGRW